ncbi:MAG: transcription termination factor Rho, partial [Bacteroidales bacterium]|nr:transcription termination factor Rho [Bacteroidales bacterium]
MEDIVYDIIEAQAIDYASKNPMGTKRKRTRITKKDTDRVYSVNGKDGENFDLKKNKTTAEPVPLFKDLPEKTEPVAEPDPVEEIPAEEPVKPAPKKRGRKSKAELAAIAEAEAKAKEEAEKKAQEEQASVEQAEPENAPEAPEPEFIPEAQFAVGADPEKDSEKQELLAQLQAKVNDHNKIADEKREAVEGGVWEGDPGDGTDFITVVDLPIEDHSVLPNYDMFDNPTTPISAPVTGYRQPAAPQPSNVAYDFTDIITANGVLEVMP